MNTVSLVPAYGKDYKSKKEVQAAWDANADFLIQCFGHPYDGKYINKADAEEGVTYNIRYKKLRSVLPIKA